ncbi:oleate hydratase [Xylogone sp. PMI_703]|nr:oleate hydratase [Xylogone sp. PMI_703]
MFNADLYICPLSSLHPGTNEFYLSVASTSRLLVVRVSTASDAGIDSQETATTRILKRGDSGLEKVDACHLRIGSRQRLELLKIMLESERALDGRRIHDLFDDTFFSFALQPWHSIIEFRRCLRKHLADIQHLSNAKTIGRAPHTVYESIVLPITTYLKKEGVDFRFHAKATDLRINTDGDPTTVSEIVLQDNEEEQMIEVNQADVVMVTVGSAHLGLQQGTNMEPPLPPSQSDEIVDGDWSLWLKLSRKSDKFGDPHNFNAHISQSRLETFTIILRSSEFTQLYEKLTHDRPGLGSLLSFADSNWCSNQTPGVQVIWGYGLNPEKDGNFVTKTMLQCTGEEIMTELLFHLNFPVEGFYRQRRPVPCLMSLATSPLLQRAHQHRPETTNLALVGQFVEIPDDTTFGMEYSVRGAQAAVYKLMGLAEKPPKIKKNPFLGCSQFT